MDATCSACGRQVEGALSRRVPGCDFCMGITNEHEDAELLRAMARAEKRGISGKNFMADVDRRFERLMGLR